MAPDLSIGKRKLGKDGYLSSLVNRHCPAPSTVQSFLLNLGRIPDLLEKLVMRLVIPYASSNLEHLSHAPSTHSSDYGNISRALFGKAVFLANSGDRVECERIRESIPA